MHGGGIGSFVFGLKQDWFPSTLDRHRHRLGSGCILQQARIVVNHARPSYTAVHKLEHETFLHGPEVLLLLPLRCSIHALSCYCTSAVAKLNELGVSLMYNFIKSLFPVS